jgi:hypothetical protein
MLEYDPDAPRPFIGNNRPRNSFIDMMLHKLMEKIMMMMNCPHLKDKSKKFLI